jgi:hypothetical protein
MLGFFSWNSEIDFNLEASVNILTPNSKNLKVQHLNKNRKYGIYLDVSNFY